MPQTITVWILGDQLLAEHPALQYAETVTNRESIRVVLIESAQVARRLPYHRKKLVLVFSAMRHYAERLRGQGYMVDEVKAATMRDGLHQHLSTHQTNTLICMAASDYTGRRFQQGLEKTLDIPVEMLANTQFLVGDFDPYPDPEPNQRVVMEYFYREMRRHFDVLMKGDEPVGGTWNYDKENRKPLPKDIELPDLLRFTLDPITQMVMEEVSRMEGCTGHVDGFNYAVTHEQAYAALGAFIQQRLESFGPYEDAMTIRDGTLFHSVLSPYVNLGLLTPMQMIRAAERAYYDGRAPINSVEGFVRQVLGWREFMYWQYWRMMPGLAESNAWDAQRPLPDFFWTGETDMNCLKHVVGRMQDTGYAHHIERLMLVSNFCTMAGIRPQEVLEWFRAGFVDAYDWVMQPNVIGMGLNADGGKIATKPYVASANYINKMSDYCKGCAFSHRQRTGKDACPFNLLYWNFLIQNEDTLRANPRSGKAVLGLRHLDEGERQQVREEAAALLDKL